MKASEVYYFICLRPIFDTFPLLLQGVEGSPLMCLTPQGTWQIEGVLSHYSNCGTSNHPAIFTSLKEWNAWIINSIGKTKYQVTSRKKSLEENSVLLSTQSSEKLSSGTPSSPPIPAALNVSSAEALVQTNPTAPSTQTSPTAPSTQSGVATPGTEQSDGGSGGIA